MFLHVSDITKNLLSISQFLKDNAAFIEFHASCYFVKELNTNRVLLKGVLKDGLYQLDLEQVLQNSSQDHSSINATCHNIISVNKDALLWHQRLGHPCSLTLSHVLKQCGINKNISDLKFCEACKFGKMHQLNFPSVVHHSTKPFEIVHGDVWGPASVVSNEGFWYYLVLVDDYTRFAWIFPLATKSEVANLILQHIKFLERQFNTKVKALQCNMGKEFTVLHKFFKDLGIQIRHTHQQNGLVERKHRHITETGLTLLAQSGLPMSFWWSSFHTATFLINRLPTPVLQHQSPYFRLYGKKPDYVFLKSFGCACYPFLRPYNTSKLLFRTSKCLFLGYSSDHRGYQCLHPSGRIYTSRTVEFHEQEFPYTELFPSGASSSSQVISQSFHPPDDIGVSSYTLPSLPSTSSDTQIQQSSTSSTTNTSSLHILLFTYQIIAQLLDLLLPSILCLIPLKTLPLCILATYIPCKLDPKLDALKPRYFRWSFLLTNLILCQRLFKVPNGRMQCLRNIMHYKARRLGYWFQSQST